DHAAGAATQSLTGLASPHAGNRPGDGGDTGDMNPPDDTGSGDGPGGAGDTAPAAGGPTTPTGGLPEPLQASTGGSAGTMPMGMPLGGMPPGGAGGARGKDAPARPKNRVVPLIPHTESVTGKVSADRIAVSSTAPQDPEPPSDDQPPRSPGRIVRRITTVKPKDERQ
ncbi:MAG: PPE family protein, partial [Mycobacterium sp.]